jgi:dolichyl-phosphate beta-glucosyltransferase
MSTEPTSPESPTATTATIQLSVVLPAYNEESRLPATLERVLAYLAQQQLDFEVLAVDDGSTDRTAELVEQIAAREPRLRLLREPHRGKGAAVRAGALAAMGRQVIFCDADLSNPVEELLRLPRQLEQAEVVIGSREGQGARRVDEPGYRHLMGRVFNWIVRTLAVEGIQDTQCGLKCFRGPVARELFSRQTIDGFGFDVEILFLARKRGYRILEVPITWRHVPRSRVDPVKDTLRMLADVVRVWLNDRLGRYD